MNLIVSCLSLVCLLFLYGCETQRRQATAYYEEQVTPSYMPTNFTQQIVPAEIIRVVVLPLSEAHLEESQLHPLDRTLSTELSKTNCFEVIPLSRDQVEQAFGARTYTLQTNVPPHFLKKIHANTGADAVLLSEITTYRGRSPLAIGLRLTLISVYTGETLWAFDDTCDAGLGTVSFGAQRYASTALRASYPFDEKHTILISPRLFFQYVAYEAFKTIRKPSVLCEQKAPAI